MLYNHYPTNIKLSGFDHLKGTSVTGSVAECRYCPIVSACLGLNKGFLGEGPAGWKPIFENSALRELGSNLIFDEVPDRAGL